MQKYSRILLKLSGEAFAGEKKQGIDASTLNNFAQEIVSLLNEKIQVGIVIGGGNIFRGLKGAAKGFDRVKGDYMGMLATVINALAMQQELTAMGVQAKVMTSTFMEPYAERYTRERATEALDNGQIVIFAGGTGNPFFTTDSAAALRAVEIGADVLLKATNVDGVYSDDPRTNPDARRYDYISYKEVIEKELKVMDLTAFTLCYENNMPIIVFDIRQKGNLQKVVKGEKIGTLIS